jgi:hypothetical protein
MDHAEHCALTGIVSERIVLPKNQGDPFFCSALVRVFLVRLADTFALFFFANVPPDGAR